MSIAFGFPSGGRVETLDGKAYIYDVEATPTSIESGLFPQYEREALSITMRRQSSTSYYLTASDNVLFKNYATVNTNFRYSLRVEDNDGAFSLSPMLRSDGDRQIYGRLPIGSYVALGNTWTFPLDAPYVDVPLGYLQGRVSSTYDSDINYVIDFYLAVTLRQAYYARINNNNEVLSWTIQTYTGADAQTYTMRWKG